MTLPINRHVQVGTQLLAEPLVSVPILLFAGVQHLVKVRVGVAVLLLGGLLVELGVQSLVQLLVGVSVLPLSGLLVHLDAQLVLTFLQLLGVLPGSYQLFQEVLPLLDVCDAIVEFGRHEDLVPHLHLLILVSLLSILVHSLSYSLQRLPVASLWYSCP